MSGGGNQKLEAAGKTEARNVSVVRPILISFPLTWRVAMSTLPRKNWREATENLAAGWTRPGRNPQPFEECQYDPYNRNCNSEDFTQMKVRLDDIS